jgi:hypothetical protein
LRRYIPIIVALLVLGGCIKRIERLPRLDVDRYFPLNVHDEYIYSGKVRRLITVREIEGIYTQALTDSTGELLMWWDLVRTDRGIGLKNIISVSGEMPDLHFYPAIPFVPWSMLVGDTLLFNTVEIRGDSINSHLRARIKYDIDGIDSVVTPAGIFAECIIMRLDYQTLDETETKYLDGESLLWYARGYGIVKFETPYDRGELLQASIAGRTTP